MTVPALGTAPLDNPDHTVEHVRIAKQLLDDRPRGVIAYHRQGTAGAAQAVTTTPLTIYTLSNVALFKGRQYILSFTSRAMQYGAQAYFYFNTYPALTITRSTLIVDAYKMNLNGATHDHIYWEQPFVVDYDVTIPTISIQVKCSAAGSFFIWTDNDGFIMIRDVGPSIQGYTGI